MKTLWFPLALLLIAVSARWGTAQRPGGVLLNDGLLAQEQMEAAVQRHRTSLQLYLAIRIEEMKRACQLTEQQAKKLEVAAKGAVEQVMQKRRNEQQNQVQPFRARFGAPARAIAVEQRLMKAAGARAKKAAEKAKRAVEELAKRAAVAAKQAVEKVAKKAFIAPDPPEALMPIPARAAWMRPMQVWQMDAQGFASVAKEPVWTKTVETLLTEKQKNALGAATAQRAAFQHEAAVNQIVATLDRELLLGAAQREAFTALVREAIGKPNADRRLDGKWLPPGFVLQMRNPQVMNVVRGVAWEKVEGILNRAQLARWKALSPTAVPIERPVAVGPPGG